MRLFNFDPTMAPEGKTAAIVMIASRNLPPTLKTVMKNLGSTLPGLANFSMHGQWVAVGEGLPPAGMNGRTLARTLCRKYGKRFTTSQ